jgi:hypothetical protein
MTAATVGAKKCNDAGCSRALPGFATPRFGAELIRSRGNFNRMADRCARRDAARLSAGDLARVPRDNVNHPWKPPGGGTEGALTHDVIHGLDITVALGLEWQVPGNRLRIVLRGVTASRGLRFFGVDLAGIELRASDIDWTFGTGAPMSGTAQDLTLALCGRKLPTGRLTGEPSARFTSE